MPAFHDALKFYEYFRERGCKIKSLLLTSNNFLG